PGLIRARGVVWARRLCRRTESAVLVSRRDRFAVPIRDCFCCGGRASLGRADPAAARRLFLAAHTRFDRPPLRYRLSLDRAHRRRERIGWCHPFERARPRSRLRPPLLLGRRGNRDGDLLLALALPPPSRRQLPPRNQRE